MAKTSLLYDQPTKRPTNKVLGATAGGGSSVGLAWLIVEAIGIDTASVLWTVGEATVTWGDVCALVTVVIGTFLGGYIKRDRMEAEDVRGSDK